MKTRISLILFSLIFILLIVTYLIRLQATDKREVSFKNGSVNLKGTLYIPKGEGPFPAVVFVHGSGPETRGNSSYSAKWFASIGYVALAYDKRGSGESDGEEKEWKRFSFNDLAEDVLAAVNFLATQEEVDKTKIGIHAASQGGWIAPLAASKTDIISFMIIKSASVCSVHEDRIFERSERLKKEGFSAADIKEVREMQVVEAKKTEEDNLPDHWTSLFEQNKNKIWFSRVYGGTDPFEQSLVAYRKWYATIYDFDSVTYLNQIDIPIFWIFGDPQLDKNGPVNKSIETLNAMGISGKPYVVHSFQKEGHNVKERKYEKSLYNWLSETNNFYKFKFKKH